MADPIEDPIDPCHELVIALAAIDAEIFDEMDHLASLFQTRIERQQALDDCLAEQISGMPEGKHVPDTLLPATSVDQMMRRTCAPIFLSTLRKAWMKCWKGEN